MTGEELKAIIAERIERDPRLRKIRAKTAKGKATKADSFQYSRICSEIMSEELAKAVLDLDDREGICAALLRGNYEEIMQTADAIQRSIDEKQGIHMQPRRPAFPAERVQQAGMGSAGAGSRGTETGATDTGAGCYYRTSSFTSNDGWKKDSCREY